jgi:Protein of unknown function (DUF3307)
MRRARLVAAVLFGVTIRGDAEEGPLDTDLARFVAFIVKHFFCDFPLQRPYQFRNKGNYGHPGGILHAAIHGIGTLAVCALVAMPLWLAALDTLIHYHVDWAKTQVNDRLALKPNNDNFWNLLGFDQMLHYLTYALLIYLRAPALTS